LEFFAALPRCGSLWHFADKQTAPGFVAYWGNNGHRLALASNGSVVNDRLRPPPKTDIDGDGRGPLSKFGFHLYQSAVLR
jgi:hypothetical protein